MSTLKQHRGFFIIFVLAALLFTSDIWAYKEFVRAESYFALGARLMIEQREWLTPHAPDEMVLNKPPLTYWLIGVSYKLAGVNYGSARLLSVIAALLLLAIVYALGVRLTGIRAGLISAAMLATSYLFLSFARMAMSDMLLTLFVTASLSSFIIVLTSKSNRAGKFALIAYVALALGVLTKGPVALALVALPIGFDLLISRRRDDVRRVHPLFGLLLFLVVAVPYFLFVYVRLGTEPLRFFFFGENLRRFTGQIYGASGRPFWYELTAFFGDFAPWSLLIFVAAVIDWTGRRSRLAQTRPRRILYLWLGSTILLFSISSFKLDYYLLPAMPAAALIIGPMISDGDRLPVYLRRFIKVWFALCSIALFGAAIFSLRVAAALSVSGSLRFLPIVIAAFGSVAIGYCVFRRTQFVSAMVLCGSIAAMLLSIELTLLPAFSQNMPSTRLAASVPANRVWYTSWAASDWANDLAFNLPPPHSVDRLNGDSGNEKLSDALRKDHRAVAVIWEREYSALLERDPSLNIFGQAATYGHGGVTLKMLRHPQRERLLVIGHDR